MTDFSSARLTTMFLLATAATGPALAEVYQEPTRGLFLERGEVAPERDASIDLSTGSSEQNRAGGLRLGLYFGEVILNSALSGGAANEAAVKISLPRLELQSGHAINWAAYLGLAHVDIDDGTDYTNFVIGAAATSKLNGFLLTFNPEWEHADDVRDDDILNLGFGIAYTLPETRAGIFQPNLEYNVVIGGEDRTVVQGTERRRIEGDEDDLALGVRWMFNDQLTLDSAIIVQAEGETVSSLPGFMRLNFRF